jgi:beta-glucanase (GH16 family)
MISLRKPHAIFVTSLAFGVLSLPLHAAAQMNPATWGSPDQPWGTRRPITAADRATIASYRTGHKKPLFEANFTDPAALGTQWTLQSDNRSDKKSCRRPESIAATPAGLELRTLATTACHAKWSTGFMISKQKFDFGFFEASVRSADITGLNNAFWLVSEGAFEIDIAEVHEPNDLHITLHYWAGTSGTSLGFDTKLNGDFAKAFHDFGVLWTPTELIFEVDGEPVAAIVTHGAIVKPVDIRFSTALADFAGKVPDNPAGHNMDVRSLRVFPQ